LGVVDLKQPLQTGDRLTTAEPHREIIVLAARTKLADSLVSCLQGPDRTVTIDLVQRTSAPGSADYVVVVQSPSTSPDLVATDARIQRARENGTLVFASFGKAGSPLLPGETLVDLSGWRGGPRHPALLQLIAQVDRGAAAPPLAAPDDAWKALRARWATRALQAAWRASVKRLGAPRSRSLFKLTAGLATTFVAVTGAWALLKANETAICKAPVAQPAISDACGAAGFGGRPTRAERDGWQTSKKSCEGLRLYLRNPKAHYHDEAMTLLASRQVQERRHWTPTERSLALFSASKSGHASEALARREVLEAAQTKAMRQCGGFSQIDGFKLKSATVRPVEWTCGPAPGGTRCQLEGNILCALDELEVETQEVCTQPAKAVRG
jgi:hypothetical protein